MDNNLPIQPFDGMVFIDSYRIKWVFSSESNGWRKVGIAENIQPVSDIMAGVITAKQKQLIDGIPEHGGHFGILTRPLLSAVPINHTAFLTDSISRIAILDNAIQITGSTSYVDSKFIGKVLHLLSGNSNDQSYLIYNNDTSTISIVGKPDIAINDKFEIIDALAINPDGVILGDILLKSDSLKITCVDGDGNELPNNCNISTLCTDPAVSKPPGLNFELNETFLSTFCVEIPGCIGPKGARGPKGPKGKDGTGDGPQGDPGNPGVDAPITPSPFTGIKITDVDDIYDSAIVDLELDSKNNKINIIKSKVKVPDDQTPATQIIAMPLDRDIEFVGDQFTFNIIRPSNDTTVDADADIIYYPLGDSQLPNTKGLITSTVGTMKLSDYLNKVTTYYSDQITQLEVKYNKQMKEYIENKDAASRTILAQLAQQVAECEFKLPIEFCLGITPDDCSPKQKAGSVGTADFGTNPPSTPGQPIVPPPSIPGTPRIPIGASTVQDINYISISRNNSNTLGSGTYLITYTGGAVRSSWRPSGAGLSVTTPPYQIDQFIVGCSLQNCGLEAILTINGVSTVTKFPLAEPYVPGSSGRPSSDGETQVTPAKGIYFSADACIAAYTAAPTPSKSMRVVIPNGSIGTIQLRLIAPGNVADGTVDINVMWFPTAIS